MGKKKSKTFSMPAGVKIFTQHGLDVQWAPKQRNATCFCPFCNYEDKHTFSIVQDTSEYNCVICEKRGNNYTFIRDLHEWAAADTPDEALDALLAAMNLPQEDQGRNILRSWGFAQSPITGEWLIPAYNPDGQLMNLFIEKPVGNSGKTRFMSSAGLNVFPFNTHSILDEDTHVWVAEGPKDGVVLEWALSQVRDASDGVPAPPDWGPPDLELPVRLKRTVDDMRTLLQNGHAVMAVPGAGTFNKDWFRYFPKKKIHLVYDNDHPAENSDGSLRQPGYQGMNRVVGMANGFKSDVSMMYWGHDGYDDSLPSGYDIEDLVSSKGPAKAILHLMANQIIRDTVVAAVTDESDELEPIPCTSFTQLLSYFSDYHITPHWRDCFALMLATVISTEAKGPPLWTRVIGPPSSGKTVLAECIATAKAYVKALSTFSGFVSGFRGPKNADGEVEDASPIALLDGKCLIVKDGDTLMSNDGKDRILAELRDLFDGVTRVHYRNQVAHDYEDLHTSIILCGTAQLRKLNRANLGERFLDTEIVSENERAEYTKSARKQAVANMMASFVEDDEEQAEVDANHPDVIRKRATLGFIKHLMANRHKEVHLSHTTMDTIEHLADFLAHMRARVHKDEQDTAPEVEMTPRIVHQLTKAAYCASLVLDEDDSDGHITKMIQNMVLATAKGHQLSATLYLYYNHHEEEVSVEDIAKHIRKGDTYTNDTLLQDMRALGIVESHTVCQRSHRKGWRLTPHAYKITGIASANLEGYRYNKPKERKRVPKRKRVKKKAPTQTTAKRKVAKKKVVRKRVPKRNK